MPADSQPTNSMFANWVGGFIVFFLCITMGYLTYAVVSSDLPDKTLNIVIYILGFVTGKLSTVVDWSFGTSSANKKKDEVIAVQAHTAAAIQAAMPSAPDKSVPIGAGETVSVKSTEPAP